MSSTFLSVLLLIVGATATLCAFFGDTVDKGAGPPIGRINLRGWVSLGCLAASLALGTCKEVHDAHEKGVKDKEQQRQQDAAATQLSSANSRLKGVNDELADTRARLSQLAQTNLLLGLEENHPITAVSWVVRLSNPSGSPANYAFHASDAVDLLFPNIPPEIRQLMSVTIAFDPGAGSFSQYQRTGNTENYQESGRWGIAPLNGASESEPHIQVLPCPLLILESRLSLQPADGSGTCTKGEGLFVYFRSLRRDSDPVSAASAYLRLLQDREIGRFQVALMAEFATDSARTAFIHAHSTLSVIKGWDSTPPGQTSISAKRFAVQFDIPGSLRNQIQEFWAQRLGNSFVDLYVGDQKAIRITCQVAVDVEASKAEPGTLKLAFHPRSTPELTVGAYDFLRTALRPPRPDGLNQTTGSRVRH